MPAGYLNVGENPLLGAQRKLRKETGYASEQWKTLGRFVVDGNRGCGVANFFLAQNCEQVSQPISGDLEEIHVQLMELDDVLNVLRADQPLELCTATALALAYMEIHNYE